MVVLAFAVLLLVIGVLSAALAQNTATVTTEVRINARQMEDGRVEFALQQREGSGWGERQFVPGRYFPAEPGHGRWVASSPYDIYVAMPDSEQSMDLMEEDPSPSVQVVSKPTPVPKPEPARFGVSAEGSLDYGRVRYAHQLNFSGDDDYWSTYMFIEGQSDHSTYSVGSLYISCSHGRGEGPYVSVRAAEGRNSIENADLDPQGEIYVGYGGLSGGAVGEHDHGFEVSGYRIGSIDGPQVWDNIAASGKYGKRFWDRAQHHQTVRVDLPTPSGVIHLSFSLDGVLDTPVQHLLEQCVADGSTHAVAGRTSEPASEVSVTTTPPQNLDGWQAPASSGKWGSNMTMTSRTDDSSYEYVSMQLGCLQESNLLRVAVWSWSAQSGPYGRLDQELPTIGTFTDGGSHAFSTKIDSAVLTGDDARSFLEQAKQSTAVTFLMPLNGRMVPATFDLTSGAIDPSTVEMLECRPQFTNYGYQDEGFVGLVDHDSDDRNVVPVTRVSAIVQDHADRAELTLTCDQDEYEHRLRAVIHLSDRADPFDPDEEINGFFYYIGRVIQTFGFTMHDTRNASLQPGQPHLMELALEPAQAGVSLKIGLMPKWDFTRKIWQLRPTFKFDISGIEENVKDDFRSCLGLR